MLGWYNGIHIPQYVELIQYTQLSYVLLQMLVLLVTHIPYYDNIHSFKHCPHTLVFTQYTQYGMLHIVFYSIGLYYEHKPNEFRYYPWLHNVHSYNWLTIMNNIQLFIGLYILIHALVILLYTNPSTHFMHVMTLDSLLHI